MARPKNASNAKPSKPQPKAKPRAAAAVARKPAPSKAGPKRKRARAEPERLSGEQRNKLLRPPPAYEDAVEATIRAWQAHARTLRLEGLSPAKLASLLRKATRAWDREETERQKREAKLAVLADARRLAEHEVWRGVLDLYAIAKAHGRRTESIAADFAFLGDVFSRERSEPDAPKES